MKEMPKRASEQVVFDRSMKLIIPRAVMDKINWWMHRTTKEVSGFGSLEFDADKNTFKVKDAFLIKQEVMSASTEIDPAAMAKMMYQMREDPMGLKWHWHSHVNMGVFWSGDDMDIIRSLGQPSWILATVFNYKDERRTAYLTSAEVKTPAGDTKRHDIFIDEITTEVINYVSQDLYEQWDKEYDDKVQESKYKYNSKYHENDHALTPYQRKMLDEFNDEKKNGIPPYSHGSRTSVLDLDWSDYGYAQCDQVAGGWLYNPIFDKDLKTESSILDAISEMGPDEIDFLIKNSGNFDFYYKRYMERDANSKNPKLPKGGSKIEDALSDEYGDYVGRSK